MKRFRKFLASVIVCAMMLTMLPSYAMAADSTSNDSASVTYESTDAQKQAVKALSEHYTRFIVVKNRPLGGSHYAYTEGQSDETGNYERSPSGTESSYHPGSEMVLLELNKDGTRTETTLLKSTDEGLIRDPDVSADGTTVVFSYKRSKNDDFHLYTMDLTVAHPADTLKQLTFGAGVTDTEPKYLANGKIVFSSSRCIQEVDCWHTPVSNLHICDADGQNIVRVGYDQVHTTYPTVTSDGRVIYTRWDYNDRNQMFIQGVFQMQQDGTNQTELFGNNMCWPTTLLHTREIPGETDKYISVVSGHHVWQAGKLVVLDLSKGRNNEDAVTYIYPEDNTAAEDINRQDHFDNLAQQGPVYRYPVALNDHEFLVSYAPDGWYDTDGKPQGGDDRMYTPFDIYYMNTETGVREVISEAITGATEKDTIAASQIVPIAEREIFNRPSMVNYKSSTATVYIGNVYEGEGMEGVDPAKQEAKYLRVVELDFRAYSLGANQASGTGSSDPHSPVSTGNGSWDVKKILGIVPIEPDGSALFTVPSETAIYFQVLDEDGEIMQTMRSWATLMPGETFSCVGCHEDKNTVPPANSGVTLAMKKGVQTLQKDLWMSGEEYENYDPYEDATGFSYSEQVQPILDESCIACHNDEVEAREKIDALEIEDTEVIDPTVATLVPTKASDWQYRNTAPADGWNQAAGFADTTGWTLGAKGGFGSGQPTSFGTPGTNWTNDQIYIRRTFEVSEELYQQIQSGEVETITLKIGYDENPIIYLNGTEIARYSGYNNKYEDKDITSAFKNSVQVGTNYLAMQGAQTGGGQFHDLGIYYDVPPDQVSDGSDTGNTNTTTGNPFSLESTPIAGGREKMYYSLSYLVLTGSKQRLDVPQFKGNATNEYTNWVSSMSQCEVLDVRQNGSSQSNMITMLEEGHHGVELSEEDLNTLRAWIDLGVPFRGAYDEASNWDNSSFYREAERKTNKREYYTALDASAKAALAGETNSQFLTISYYDSTGALIKTAMGEDLVELTPDTVAPLEAGNKIVVELPAGQQYLGFTLTNNVKESIVYVPSGVFTYTVPNNPGEVLPKNSLLYSYPQMMARIPSEEELTGEHLLSVNTYDSATNDSIFPHASSNSNYGSQPYGSANFQARNAIDGFTTNRGHGSWPHQSWGPDKNVEDLWYTIDFGRAVMVNSLTIYARADFPHDAVFNSVKAEFSDGTILDLGALEQVYEGQTFALPETMTTTSVKFWLEAPADTWCAFTEVEVYGSELPFDLPGDVNLNGEVTAEDALLALQAATKKITLTDRQIRVGDVDDEEGVAANDALMILQAATKKIALSNKGVAVSKEDLVTYLGEDLVAENYTSATFAVYEEALAQGQTVYDDPAASALEIYRAVMSLKAAREGLIEIPPITKTALKLMIDRTVEESRYTELSYAAYETALTEAKTVYNDKNANKEAVYNAVMSMADAYAALAEATPDGMAASFSKLTGKFTVNNPTSGALWANWSQMDQGSLDASENRDNLRFQMTVQYVSDNPDIDASEIWKKLTVKLRSSDKAGVEGDPNGESNTEHNYGWDMEASAYDAGTDTLQISIPLSQAKTNSRGLMDWSDVQRLIVISDLKTDVVTGDRYQYYMILSDPMIVDVSDSHTAQTELKAYVESVKDTDTTGATAEQAEAFYVALETAQALVRRSGDYVSQYNMAQAKTALQNALAAL